MAPEPQERLVFHVDLDAFFVEVERQENPGLIGKPVIIGGLGPRGVVSTASYEARRFGVHSAQAMSVARRLAPNAIYLRGNHKLYRDVSKKFMAILDEYSPLVVPMSVDEAYMDMTGTERSLGDPLDTANKIRANVKDSLRLPVSIGIGPSKLVAKVATEHAKPNGVFRVRQEDARAFFAPQPVRNMPGIGPKAEEALKELGITSLGQLATAEDGPLRRALGPNHSGYLKQRARGIDRSPIRERPKSKSISAETTFSSDVIEIEKLEEVLKDLSERVGTRLRRTGQLAKQAGIKLRYGDFSTFTRQKTFVTPGDGDQLIYEMAAGLLRVEMARRGDPVRLIGVSVSGLGEQAAQLSLLDATPLTDTHTSEAIDSIRERYGSDSISRGMKSKST